MKLLFSDFFEVTPKKIDRHGAFNISLLSDLPLFIDPFLLFNSKKRIYRKLHDEIIKYLRFLRDKAADQKLNPGLIEAWYRFPEIKQTWLGFAFEGNQGRGLGGKFATALHRNLNKIFGDFGEEKITRGSHLEKLCLIEDGVGKDTISDFTTNLIHAYLLEYTEKFAQKYIRPELRRDCGVQKVRFNYDTETWGKGVFNLPFYEGSHVLLTPINILTKDDTWINKTDLLDEFDRIPAAIPNSALRSEVNNYFRKLLPKEPKRKDERNAARLTLLEYPGLIDFFIKYKEDHGESAANISSEKVAFSRQLYLEQFKLLAELLQQHSAFYSLAGNTYEEALERAHFLKDVIENKGGHRIFYIRGKPIEREEDLHILYRLTWFASSSEVTREANDGRGPVDFKVARGSRDKSLVEFKLAKNSQLKRNLQRQTKIYEKASDALRTVKVIVYFTKQEEARVERVLSDLKMTGSRDVIMIDARKDNKPSGSKA
jgi:hypothetical protein